jgi:prepilin-type processing-associated H-X9-DG protein
MGKGQLSCAEVRAILRDYAIEGRTDFDGHFAECAACRAALEAERAALSRLDALGPVEPPAGLADKTLRSIAEAERETGRAAEERGRKRVPRLVTAVASVCLVALAAAIVLPALGRAREAARRSSSANNLKQMGLVLKMYANEFRGEKYPPLAPYDDISVFDLRTIYPKFLSDLSVLINPELPNANELNDQLRGALAKSPPDWDVAHHIVAQSYVYTGYDVKDDSDLAEFQEARARARGEDLEIAGRRIYRLREGVERFYITDINNPAASAAAQLDIPVLMENPSTRDRGIHVLYMDGHVEFLERGEKFPATEAARRAFPLPPLQK